MKKARVTLQLSWPFVNAHWADDRHVPVILIFYAKDVFFKHVFFDTSLPGVRIGLTRKLNDLLMMPHQVYFLI